MAAFALIDQIVQIGREISCKFARPFTIDTDGTIFACPTVGLMHPLPCQEVVDGFDYAVLSSNFRYLKLCR